MEERDGDDALQATYINGARLDEYVLMNRNSTNYWYMESPIIGSVAALVNSSGAIQEGYTYRAYGQATVHTGAGNDGVWFTTDDATAGSSALGNSYLFTGRYWDSTISLQYNRARWYAPTPGRWLSRDPSGYVDGVNLYEYVLSNPVPWSDPTGVQKQEEKPCCCCCASGASLNQVEAWPNARNPRVQGHAIRINMILQWLRAGGTGGSEDCDFDWWEWVDARLPDDTRVATDIPQHQWTDMPAWRAEQGTPDPVTALWNEPDRQKCPGIWTLSRPDRVVKDNPRATLGVILTRYFVLILTGAQSETCLEVCGRPNRVIVTATQELGGHGGTFATGTSIAYPPPPSLPW